MKEALLGLMATAIIVMGLFVWAAFKNSSNVEIRLQQIESNVGSLIANFLIHHRILESHNLKELPHASE